MQRRKIMSALLSGAAALGASTFTCNALAAPGGDYPKRPIHVIVPYAAGGVVDVQTRALTQTLQGILKQPIVVEAKPGASGSIAAETVARAAPDGYTLLVSASFLINTPLMESNLRWKMQDFTPIGRFSLSTSYFTVPMTSPAKTVREFVDMAKKASPPLQYADGGIGTPQSMSTMMFRTAAGIPLEMVMYKGAPPAIPDLINNRVSMSILPSAVAIPQINGKKLRVLANISDKRSNELPDVPTFAEVGFPEATAVSWYGLHAPAGTPQVIIQKLEAAMREATATEEVKKRLIAAAGEEAFMDTKEFTTFIENDVQRWTKMMKAIQQ